MAFSEINSIAVIVLVLTSIPYLFGPIAIRFKQKYEVSPQVARIPAYDELPQDVREFFDNVTTALQFEGFEVFDDVFLLPSAVPNVKVLILGLANRTTFATAAASAIYVKTPHEIKLQLASLEFGTRCRNAEYRVINTINSPIVSSLRELPDKLTIQLPQVCDPRRLYQLHLLNTRRFVGLEKSYLRIDSEFRGDGLANLKAVLSEQLLEQVEAGYLYLPEGSSHYQPTWKGAFIMVWRELWPLKSLRRARVCRRAESFLAAVGERL